MFSLISLHLDNLFVTLREVITVRVVLKLQFALVHPLVVSRVPIGYCSFLEFLTNFEIRSCPCQGLHTLDLLHPLGLINELLHSKLFAGKQSVIIN